MGDLVWSVIILMIAGPVFVIALEWLNRRRERKSKRS